MTDLLIVLGGIGAFALVATVFEILANHYNWE